MRPPAAGKRGEHARVHCRRIRFRLSPRPIRFLGLGAGSCFLAFGGGRRFADLVEVLRTRQQRLRVHARGEPADAQVQVRAGRASGCTDLADRLATLDFIAGLQGDRRRVETRADDQAVTVIDIALAAVSVSVARSSVRTMGMRLPKWESPPLCDAPPASRLNEPLPEPAAANGF